MKNNISIFSVLILISFSCEKEIALNNLTNCYSSKSIIKTAENVKGRISILDNKHPDLWCIKSMQGIIGYDRPTYDSFDTVIPCSLPDSLKIQDLIVVFSGDLKSTGQDFKSTPDSMYYSDIYYSDLRELSSLNQNK